MELDHSSIEPYIAKPKDEASPSHMEFSDDKKKSLHKYNIESITKRGDNEKSSAPSRINRFKPKMPSIHFSQSQTHKDSLYKTVRLSPPPLNLPSNPSPRRITPPPHPPPFHVSYVNENPLTFFMSPHTLSPIISPNPTVDSQLNSSYMFPSLGVNQQPGSDDHLSLYAPMYSNNGIVFQQPQFPLSHFPQHASLLNPTPIYRHYPAQLYQAPYDLNTPSHNTESTPFYPNYIQSNSRDGNTKHTSSINPK